MEYSLLSYQMNSFIYFFGHFITTAIDLTLLVLFTQR
jgi:hypothetical protein